jgi:hypothetical protein
MGALAHTNASALLQQQSAAPPAPAAAGTHKSWLQPRSQQGGVVHRTHTRCRRPRSHAGADMPRGALHCEPVMCPPLLCNWPWHYGGGQMPLRGGPLTSGGRATPGGSTAGAAAAFQAWMTGTQALLHPAAWPVCLAHPWATDLALRAMGTLYCPQHAPLPTGQCPPCSPHEGSSPHLQQPRGRSDLPPPQGLAVACSCKMTGGGPNCPRP